MNLLWEVEGAIVGFVGAYHHRSQRVGHVFTVNVHPSMRGQGLGVKLLDGCHERLSALGMRRVILEVNVENAVAIRLYERCGYRLAKRLPNYYTQYENPDAFLFVRELVAT